MSIAVEQRPATAQGGPPSRSRRRWILVAVTAAVAVVLVPLLWAQQVDALTTGPTSGVRTDVPLVSVSASETSRFIAVAESGPAAKVLASFTNTTPLPIEVTGVDPVTLPDWCGWHAQSTQVRTDPQTLATRPLDPENPLTLDPGATMDVIVAGEFRCARGGLMRGSTTVMNTMPVEYSIAGVIDRRQDVPLGFEWGWHRGTDPQHYIDSFVTVQP